MSQQGKGYQSKQSLLEQPMAAEPLCQDLRGLVHDCLAKHLYESAAFYADKLVTLSDGTPGDVYVLAHVRALAALAPSCQSNRLKGGNGNVPFWPCRKPRGDHR